MGRKKIEIIQAMYGIATLGLLALTQNTDYVWNEIVLE